MDVQRVLPADAVRPIWSSASALVYIGGFVVLWATVALIAVADDGGGAWAVAGAALVAAAIAFVVAEALAGAERAIAAGVAATLAVVFVSVAAGGALDAVGLLDTELDEYEPSIIPVSAVLVAGAAAAILRYRAPLPVLLIALAVWLNVVELNSLIDANNGDELLSITAGVLLIAAGVLVDRAEREPFGFWLHAVGGLALGGGLAVLAGDGAWAFTGLLGLAFVVLAFALGRSSYAVLGALWILVATTLFAVEPLGVAGSVLPFFPPGEGSTLEAWQVALSYLVAGLLIGGIGVAGRLTWPGRTGPGAPPASRP